MVEEHRFGAWCRGHGYQDVWQALPYANLDAVDEVQAAYVTGDRYTLDTLSADRLAFATWRYRHGQMTDHGPIPQCRALAAVLIECVPGVQGGEPVIRGTRTPVRTIAVLWEVYAGDLAEISLALPHLSSDEIAAALAYYQSHREEIDLAIAEHEAIAYEVLA